jgi:hypothetical protein
VRQLKGAEQQGFRARRDDHPYGHGPLPRHLGERLRDRAEHFRADPRPDLGDDPRLVLGVPVRRGVPRDVVLEIGERLVVPAVLVEPYLMIGGERPGNVSQHPAPPSRAVVLPRLQPQHTPHRQPPPGRPYLAHAISGRRAPDHRYIHKQLPHVHGKADGVLTARFDVANGHFGAVMTLAAAHNPSIGPAARTASRSIDLRGSTYSKEAPEFDRDVPDYAPRIGRSA